VERDADARRTQRGSNVNGITPDFTAPPVPGSSDSRLCHCNLRDTIRCWSRYARELRADLATARGHPDEEVLVCDLRDAEAHLSELLAIVREKVRAA
jgi:hypothetical protein